jgi:serine/threonine protein kinase
LFDVRLLREDGRDLVEKRLLPRFRREPEARAALVREAQVLTSVRHPAVPELVRVGADDKGPFLVETFAAGASVRRIVDFWDSRGGVPPRLAGHLARQAFAALTELHGLFGHDGPLSFVHADIGPDHVLLGPAGDVRFVDFGASRVATLSHALLGQGRGTLPFVAPEIARGEIAPNAAGDVYSLAATILFLVAREPICRAREEAAMLLEIGSRGVRVDLLDQAESFRPAEREALRRALALDPARRHTRAVEVLTAFDAP